MEERADQWHFKRWWPVLIPLVWLAIMTWHWASYHREEVAARREKTTHGEIIASTPWHGIWSGSRTSRPRDISITFVTFRYVVDGRTYQHVGTDPIYEPSGVVVYYDAAEPSRSSLQSLWIGAEATLSLIHYMALGLIWIVAGVVSRLVYVHRRARDGQPVK